MEAQAPVKRWRSARAVLVAAFVLMPVAAVPDTIAFTSERDGWRTIYTMAPDGTGVRRLFARYVGYMEFLPTWSPDGTRLAIVRGEIGYATDILRTWDRLGLCLTGPGGEQVTEIHRESGLNAPSWSPQGDRIAFHIRRDSPPVAIYSDVKWIGLGDGSVNLVTPGPRAPSNEPDWSPDGSRLMVVGGGRLFACCGGWCGTYCEGDVCGGHGGDCWGTSVVPNPWGAVKRAFALPGQPFARTQEHLPHSAPAP